MTRPLQFCHLHALPFTGANVIEALTRNRFFCLACRRLSKPTADSPADPMLAQCANCGAIGKFQLLPPVISPPPAKKNEVQL
jgi:hypothetical protein